VSECWAPEKYELSIKTIQNMDCAVITKTIQNKKEDKYIGEVKLSSNLQRLSLTL
jgi:hypothetical protein